MRPSFAAALRNPISAIGGALTTASSLLFIFLIHLFGLIGRSIIPCGLWLERRRTRVSIAAPAQRQYGVGAIVVLLVIGA